jgi:hypothetical protein
VAVARRTDGDGLRPDQHVDGAGGGAGFHREAAELACHHAAVGSAGYHVHGAQELGRPTRGGRRVHRLGMADLLDPPGTEEDDGVGE